MKQLNPAPLSGVPVRVIRLREAMHRTGKTRASLYCDIAAGKFPAQIKIGPSAVGWIESEIDDYIHSLIAASRGAA